VARDLLTETGSIFVQIGDENVHLVRCVLDEVFTSENFISQITLKKMGDWRLSSWPVPATTCSGSARAGQRPSIGNCIFPKCLEREKEPALATAG